MAAQNSSTRTPTDTLAMAAFSTEIHRRTLDFSRRAMAPLMSEDDSLAPFTDLVSLYLGEGKTLRALAVSVGSFVAGGPAVGCDEVALDLGVAMELYQASALVHDDLIDHAQTRRGHASAHIAARHTVGRDHAKASAILAGDALLSLTHLATHHACERLSTEDPATAATIHRQVAAMTLEVACGQFLDVTAESMDLSDPVALERRIREVIAIKAGHYSVMRPLILGATLSGASPTMIDALTRAGTDWGVAIQLRDDELGVFGDAETMGKSTSSDIAEGKRTVLLALALQMADETGRRALVERWGRPPSAEDLAVIRSVIRDSGAHECHEEAIAALVTSGHRAIDELAIDEERRRVLTGFASLLTDRRH